MADHSIPPPDAAVAAAAIVWGVTKWVALAAGGLIVSAFTAVFAWIWRTDRAVHAMATAEEQDRAAREQFRRELVAWLTRMESRVTAGELTQAEQRGEQRGREAGRKERHDQ